LGAGELVVALIGLGWIVVAALWAVPGVFIIDGFVYQAMIDAFARNGSFLVTNGYTEYLNGALQLNLMRVVDGQLVPQYPGGWGILAAPAYLAAGLRGVIMLNAVASALTLPLVWMIARSLFDDRRIATRAALVYGLASFAVDYAFGVWPHGVSTFLITAAVAAIVAGWRGAAPAELRGALAAGLLLGLDVNIRVDAVIAAAPLALWLLGAARRPYAAFALMLAGLLPGVAAAAAINQVKFGIPSPITYGATHGAVSLGYYAQLAPLAAVGALAGLSLGNLRVRRAAFSRTGLVLGAVAVAVLVLIVPGARQSVSRIVEGAWVLIVDFQDYRASTHGLTVMDDGTIRMFGLVKKALLQSLPYVAAVIVLLPRLWRGPDRAAMWFCALFVGLGIAPYAFGSWHGGTSNNMRYLLDVVPILAILSAVVLREISELVRHRGGPLTVVAALAVCGGAILYAQARGYDLFFACENTLPNAIVLAIAGLSLVVLATQGSVRGYSAAMLRGVVVLGLVVAFLSAWGFDLGVSQYKRAVTVQLDTLTGDLPDNALVATFTPAVAGFRINRPPALTAQAYYSDPTNAADLTSLIAQAFAEGRPVFAQGRELADMLVAAGVASEPAPRYGIGERFDLYQMKPPASGSGETQ